MFEECRYAPFSLSIAAIQDLAGDKWTLLIVRDMMTVDRHRYNDSLARCAMTIT